MILWHGSNKEFSRFKKAEKRISNDLYGGGIAYFTSDKNIAINYAKTRVSAYGGEPYLFKVDVTMKKIFDVDAEFTGKELLNIIVHLKDLEGFARSAGLLGYGENKYIVSSRLQDGRVTLKGDRVWKGISSGGIRTSQAQEVLIKSGYDGLRYNGGVLTTDTHSHDVYCPYKESSIRIESVTRILSPDKKITTKDHPVDVQGLVEEKIEWKDPIQPALNISRKNLPQIKDPEQYCSDMELEFEKIKLPSSEVRPIQSEYDYDKIRAISSSKGRKNPIVISLDNYILDGHHRWVSNHMEGNSSIDCFRIKKNILELLAQSKTHAAAIKRMNELAWTKHNNRFLI